MLGGYFVVRNCVIEGTQDDSIAGNAQAATIGTTSLSRDQVGVTKGTLPQNPVFFMNGTTVLLC